MEIQKSIRYRINVSTSIKGVKTWDCTTEFNHETSYPNLDAPSDMEFVLEQSDILVKELEKRYPITEVIVK